MTRLLFALAAASAAFSADASASAGCADHWKPCDTRRPRRNPRALKEKQGEPEP